MTKTKRATKTQPAKKTPAAKKRAAKKPAAKKPAAKKPAAKKSVPAKHAFECSDLMLCVAEAMLEAELLKTDLRVPQLQPPDDYDPDDESESWRDAVENNQSAAIRAVEALVDQNRDKLKLVKEIQSVLVAIADDYEDVDIWSLDGIEACTALESISIWSRDATLDLSPLAKLSALHTVDLSLAKPSNYAPLVDIPKLRTVVGEVDTNTAAKLRARKVAIKNK